VRAYESMLVIAPTVPEEEIDAFIDKFAQLIVNQGGEITEIDRLGRRRLAYEIRDFTEGYYVVLYFNAEPDAIVELERVYKITDNVLRSVVVRKDG
jgi:small subunit ribosomal protein S6